MIPEPLKLETLDYWMPGLISDGSMIVLALFLLKDNHSEIIMVELSILGY